MIPIKSPRVARRYLNFDIADRIDHGWWKRYALQCQYDMLIASGIASSDPRYVAAMAAYDAGDVYGMGEITRALSEA